MGKELVRRKMIDILKMDLCHVAHVAQLETMCFSMPWSENSIKKELDNPLSLWLVACDGDEVLGYVGSQSVMGESDMMNLAVHPDHRRQGLAEQLVAALVSELKACGNYSLTLEVRQSNVPALSLYEKLGFQVVGKRPRYYQNPKEDAMILRKEWEI